MRVRTRSLNAIGSDPIGGVENAIGSDPIGGVESGGVAEICEGHPFFATGKMPVVPVSAAGEFMVYYPCKT